MCFIHAQSKVLLYVLNWILLKWMCFVKCTPINLCVDSPNFLNLARIVVFHQVCLQFTTIHVSLQI
jgi:hypothetical protein